jgi:surface antigen
VYQLVKRQPQWTFYWGNCTRYVAQYKNVNWSGNAKDWLRNARSKWHETGSTPGVWSIVVFHGRGYNPTYGHVWIVIDVTANDIIVKDMNYRRLNEVTVRKVPKTDRAIQWYIYVD